MELEDSLACCTCRRRRTRVILLHLQPCTGPSADSPTEDLLAAVEREKAARAQRAKTWAAASPKEPSPARRVSDREIVIGPDYAPSPEIARADNLPDSRRGTLHELTMLSADSKIYPGIERKPSVPDVDLGIPDPRFRGLGLTPELFKGDADVLGHAFNTAPDTPEISRPAPYDRQVVVYRPPNLDRDAPAPFIVVNDGPGYVETMRRVMDSLIADNRLPHNLIALFVASGGSDAQGSQRGLEYDTCSGTFAEFIDKEVVPFVSAECGVHLTSNPIGRAAMGGSSGGCAAFSMAWYRPDLFRRVLVYSATLTNQQYPYNPELPHGHWELHSGQELIVNSASKPIKVCLFNPELDSGWNLPAETYHNWVLANRRTAAGLARKGYDYRHVFCEQAGHVDRRVVDQTLAEGLEWLFDGYEQQ